MERKYKVIELSGGPADGMRKEIPIGVAEYQCNIKGAVDYCNGYYQYKDADRTTKDGIPVFAFIKYVKNR